MTKVINIEKNIPYYSEEVICIKCCHRWLAVFPTTTLLKDLECKNCGQGFVILTGQKYPE